MKRADTIPAFVGWDSWWEAPGAAGIYLHGALCELGTGAPSGWVQPPTPHPQPQPACSVVSRPGFRPTHLLCNLQDAQPGLWEVCAPDLALPGL